MTYSESNILKCLQYYMTLLASALYLHNLFKIFVSVGLYCDGDAWVSCPVSAAWHFCVAAHWLKYHCYKQAPSRYDLR